MNSNQNFNDEEEPSPEVLSKEFAHCQKQISSSQEFNQQSNNRNNQGLTKQHSKQSMTIENKAKSKEPSLNNQSLNVSKANTCACGIPSKFENFNIQQLTYTIMKDYSQMRISKEEDFMERMKFDIYKRQIKEDRINQLVDQNKLKLDEKERIKAFNRLIGDANRRIEAQENLDKMKERLDEDIFITPQKKYKDDEWKEIYNERFAKYKDDNQRKIEEKSKVKQELERIKEEEEANLCKVKKAPKKDIDQASKRLYEESIKRRLKIDNKLSKVNYENSPSKYKKQLDEEDNSNILNYQDKRRFQSKQDNKEMKRIAAPERKKTNQPVSEFNNKRFEVSYNQAVKPRNPSSKREKVPVMANYQQKYLEQYFDDEEVLKNIPKPLNNNNNSNSISMTPSENNTSILNHKKNIDLAQMKKLNVNNYSDIPNNDKTNTLSLKERDANKIVDQFFKQKYKNV